MSPADFQFFQGTSPLLNEGEHTIYWGGDTGSYLEIPLVNIADKSRAVLWTTLTFAKFNTHTWGLA
jgi:hypothetical protein